MARLLKQSTAFTFRIGPFLDSTDGVTAETGLSIGQADIQISKDGGAFAQTSASPTTTHDTDGWYQCPLTTTDTNTLGPLTVQIVMSGALPVWEHFMVVPANVYDSLVDGSDNLQVDTTQIEGSDATNQINAACDTALSDYDAVVPADLPTNFGDLSITATTGRVDVAAVGGTAQTANDNGADINTLLTRIVGTLAAGTHNAQSGDAYAYLGTNLGALGANATEAGGTGDHLSAVPWNSAWDAEVQSECNDALVANHLDHLFATAYDATSKPGAADALLNEMVEDDSGVTRYTVNALENGPSGSGASAASIADAVWDEARSGHVSSGSFGEAFRGTTIGTAQSGTTSTIVLASGAVTSDDQLNGATVRIVGGTGAGQSGRVIDDSTASSDSCDVSPNWDTAPDNTSVYEIIHTAPSSTATLPNVNVTQISGDSTAADNLEAAFDGTGYDLGGIDVSELNTAVDAIGSDGTGLTEAGGTGDHLSALPTAAGIADAVWDEAKAGHVTAGSFGEEVQAHALSTEISALNDVTAAEVRTEMDSNSTQLAAIVADTNELQTDDVPGLIAALDVVVDRVEADTQNIQSRLPASLSNGAIDANVARINDTAVTGDGTSGTEWGPA